MEESKYDILKAVADYYDQLKSDSLDAALKLYIYCSKHHVEDDIYMIDNVKCKRTFLCYKSGVAYFQPINSDERIFDGYFGAMHIVNFGE